MERSLKVSLSISGPSKSSAKGYTILFRQFTGTVTCKGSSFSAGTGPDNTFKNLILEGPLLSYLKPGLYK